MVATFLSGAIVTLHLVAALYFVKFWRRANDWLFLAFAVAFGVEGLNRIRFLFIEHPNEGSLGIYAVRTAAFLAILAAILIRNLQSQNRG